MSRERLGGMFMLCVFQVDKGSALLVAIFNDTSGSSSV